MGFFELVFGLWLLAQLNEAWANDASCNNDRSGEETALSVLTNVAGQIIDRAKKYEHIKESLESYSLLGKPTDCEDILSINKSAVSGVYKIWPRSRILNGPFSVFCDMKDSNGGWTVIQRRGDFDSSKEYFFQDWAAYKAGFGKLKEDFWLGNDKIFALTNQRACSIKFDLSDWTGNWTYATYDEFWIDDEKHNYTAHVRGYRGNAGDSFFNTDGMAFSTKDRDHDTGNQNCAVSFKGAWWYAACHTSNLNGLYLRGTHASFADGVNWKDFKGYNYSLKDAIIKIRSKNFSEKMEMTPLMF